MKAPVSSCSQYQSEASSVRLRIARFAFAQLGRPFADRLFQHLVEILELLVQQPHLQHVVDARLDFDQIERLADEILRAGLQRAQLVTRLGREHDDREVAVGIVRLEALHHLESIHAGHLQIEQDQVVGVPAMQRADLLRIHRRGHAGVAGLAQQLLEQADIGLLIVDDQDARGKNVRGADHHAVFSPLARADCVVANFSATSSVAMNSLTLMGLVR